MPCCSRVRQTRPVSTRSDENARNVLDHPSVARVAAALHAAGVHGQIRELPESAPTAATAAAQLGCGVGAIANSLVFAAETHDDPAVEPVLVLASGAHRVDTARTAALFGARRLRRADPDLVRAATGFPIGGVAPLAHSRPLRTLVDVALREHDVVWAAGGHPHTVFPTTFDELIRLTGGTPAEVGD
jgi:prolyl-tRNA editing enzyme YbaK/EbsC (Cys-tRNA(Pro) deacylase)